MLDYVVVYVWVFGTFHQAKMLGPDIILHAVKNKTRVLRDSEGEVVTLLYCDEALLASLTDNNPTGAEHLHVV